MNDNWKKNIVLFLTSQTISLFGTSLVQYAIAWYITLKTQSGVMMMISIICGFIPTFLLSPFAGVWADRYNRKLLIALSDSIIAVSTLALAIMLFMGNDAIWLFFAISAIRALGTGVQTPAVGAFIPQLVPEDKLMRVNAVNGSIQSMVMLVSPMLSGALMSMASIESIFFIDVITAAVGVSVLLLFLHVPAHSKAAQKQPISYFDDMRDGMRYIASHAYVRRFFLYSAIFFVMVTPVAFLTPLQVSRSFGNDVWRLTAVEIVFAGGMIIGGIIIASWGGFKNKIYTLALSNLVTGACTVVLGIIPVFWAYLLFMALIGVVMPMFSTPSTVLLQQKVEEEYLGRVFGVMGMISSSMMPLGMLAFGPIADLIKIEWLLIATGLLLFAESVLMIKDKVLVAAGK